MAWAQRAGPLAKNPCDNTSSTGTKPFIPTRPLLGPPENKPWGTWIFFTTFKWGRLHDGPSSQELRVEAHPRLHHSWSSTCVEDYTNRTVFKPWCHWRKYSLAKNRIPIITILNLESVAAPKLINRVARHSHPSKHPVAGSKHPTIPWHCDLLCNPAPRINLKG